MLDKPNKVMPALYGGIIMGVISGVPFLNIINCFCCAGILLGGFLSVFFYKNELTQEMSPLTSSDALQIGVLAGLFGAFVGTMINGVLLFSIGNVTGEIVADAVRNLVESLGVSSQLPPGTLEQLEGVKNRDFSMLTVVFTFFQSIIIDPLFGLLGGLIGYSVFKPKPSMMNDPPTYRPPMQP